MTSNKKQHYVPRFYLKNFSWDEEKAINLINKKSGKIIAKSNLYNQCHEPYFYGEDLIVEEAFSKLEGEASKVIKGILRLQKIPLPRSADHHTLLMHTLFQLTRTKHAAREQGEMATNLIRNMIKKDGSFSDLDTSLIRVEFKHPTGLSLQAAAKAIPLAMDLDFKLLKNTTPLQIITSDNPVVLYNSCYEAGTFGSYTGLATKGLQIFFPLSPNYLLVFYDKQAYKIGEKRSSVAMISEINDVRQLNDLQILNSLENIYFHRSFHWSELEKSVKRTARHEQSKKSILSEYPEKDQANGINSSTLHIHRPDHKIRLRLQCMRQLWTPEKVNIPHKPLRNPELVQINNEFLQLVDQKRYLLSEFSKYIQDMIQLGKNHPLVTANSK